MGEKTNFYGDKLIYLKTMPNGKVIHILRDPRNVMASFKKFTNSRNQII